jgi:hypothetical protein
VEVEFWSLTPTSSVQPSASPIGYAGWALCFNLLFPLMTDGGKGLPWLLSGMEIAASPGGVLRVNFHRILPALA